MTKVQLSEDYALSKNVTLDSLVIEYINQDYFIFSTATHPAVGKYVVMAKYSEEDLKQK